ncbi:NADPH:quinone oxidoreductase family protein [Aeromicrobium fastidiosum]|uniref:NADPH:quinone oxidoreductase family protein n=1 Tax=Aeromicrobium fastidiosum TaxID=52699 RepID=A0A641AK30_9ACTN|nr:NADPH:quinone oxidoreductase family protein [Aeromicrobium fastidiosum]KAA1373092.1 NADPH:quinone oxidoreductase family protein [Aeromicrobium fastidiosum]MBP2391077.1 NADPH2:quinone reductase [Aeromicrobium fastidiosum]
MRALLLTSLTGPAGLRLTEVDDPHGDSLVHIDVRAAGVNFPDLLVMRGEYQLKTEPPFVPGSEIAGVVRSAPSGSGFSAGDRVIALAGQGGLAERVAVHPGVVRHAPSGLDHAEAVTMLVNFQTAVFALETRARVSAGQTVVVMGAAGGIGTATVQVAHALGVEVIAVVKRPGADEFLRTAGADHVVALADGWSGRVRELTDGRGADVLVDPVGGPAFDDAVRSLAPGGRLVVVGFAAGGIPTVTVNRLLLRNVGVLGAGWGEYLRTDPRALGQVASRLDELVTAGLRPAVNHRYAFGDGVRAYTDLASGAVFGKAVIDVSSDPA